MENLAFTTLIILLFAVPGYVYRSIYFSEDFSKEVVPKSITEEVYLSILFSLPFHALMFLTLDKLYTRSLSGLYIDLSMVIGALTGQYAEDSQTGRTSLADNVYRYFLPITCYFLLATTVAGAAGRLFRWLVWTYKLDVMLPSLFRYRNRWLYTFTGRDRNSPERLFGIVDALCLLGAEKTRMYRGVVFGFDSDGNGLEQIRLGLAYRGKFREAKNEDGSETKNEFYWEEVPGSILLLKYSTVLSLNVTYVPESLFNPNSPSFLLPQTPPETDSNDSAVAPASPAPDPAQPVESSHKLPE